MLPSLSRLNVKTLCQPCTPVDALLDYWSEREDVLSSEQLEKIPEDYAGARAECAICFNRLRKAAPHGGIEVIVAVDKDISCGHAFHKECLTNWFQEQEKSLGPLTCPLCSQTFVDATIDTLFNRIDGRRRAESPQEELEREIRQIRAENPRELEWPLFYNEYGYVELELIPNNISLRVPPEHVPDWKRYTYERFIEKYNVDTLTFDQWIELLAKSVAQRSAWVGYYVIVWELQGLKEGVLDQYDMTRTQSMQLLKDVKDAREEGNSWQEIFLALALGRVP